MAILARLGVTRQVFDACSMVSTVRWKGGITQ